jgi:carbon monoxide dehydrogenase subunit G
MLRLEGESAALQGVAGKSVNLLFQDPGEAARLDWQCTVHIGGSLKAAVGVSEVKAAAGTACFSSSSECIKCAMPLCRGGRLAVVSI